MESIVQKESVELIVYFAGGSRKTYTRINNTPHPYMAIAYRKYALIYTKDDLGVLISVYV